MAAPTTMRLALQQPRGQQAGSAPRCQAARAPRALPRDQQQAPGPSKLAAGLLGAAAALSLALSPPADAAEGFLKSTGAWVGWGGGRAGLGAHTRSSPHWGAWAAGERTAPLPPPQQLSV